MKVLGPIALCVVLLAPAARADMAELLAKAEEDYGALEFEPCAQTAEEALREPGTASDRVKGYQLLGLCRAALEDTEGATDAFVLMLAIDQNAALPDGLSPRFTSSYLEAKGQWVGRKPFDIQITEDQVSGKTRSLKLSIVDRPALLESVAWRDGDGELSASTKVAEKMLLEVPKNLAQELVFFDAHKGALVVLPLPQAEQEKTEALAEQKGGETAEGEDEGSGLWVWAGVGAVGVVGVVAAAAVGGVIAYGVATGLITGPEQQITLQSGVDFGD